MNENRPLFPLFSPEEQQVLKRLEAQRTMLRRKPLLWTVIIVTFILIAIIFSVIHESDKYQNATWPVVTMIFCTVAFFGGMAWLVFRFPDRHSVSYWYKAIMLRRLVPEMLPGWVSSTSHRLKTEDIRKSGLFKDKANRIVREDYLFGPAGKIVAEVYQIALQVKAQEDAGGTSGGNVTSDFVTNHFYGFFYRVHCPVVFPCEVWVFPKQRKMNAEVDDWAEITEEKYAHRPDRFLLETGDETFDEHFSTYTTNLALAPKVLTPSRRQNLLEVDRLFATSCAFSYTNNKVFAMIGYSSDPLDFDIGHPVDEELLQKHARELAQMKDIALLITGDVSR